jgi:hypothetical protein
VGTVVVDDHILRDLLAGERSLDLGGFGAGGIATTGLWLFRLCSAFAVSSVSGKLSKPVSALSEDLQAAFRARIIALPDEILVLSLGDLAWPMAQLRAHHRAAGRNLSAAMTEALAVAHHLQGELAVSRHDVGPNLRAAAEADGIAFHVL